MRVLPVGILRVTLTPENLATTAALCTCCTQLIRQGVPTLSRFSDSDSDDTGVTNVACNLQSYPTDRKWSFTYEPYGASDESARGLGAETDQANGAQLRNSSTYKGEIVDFRRGSKPDSRGRVQTACPSGLSQTLDHLVASEVLYLVHISTLTMWTHARSKRGATVTKI